MRLQGCLRVRHQALTLRDQCFSFLWRADDIRLLASRSRAYVNLCARLAIVCGEAMFQKTFPCPPIAALAGGLNASKGLLPSLFPRLFDLSCQFRKTVYPIGQGRDANAHGPASLRLVQTVG